MSDIIQHRKGGVNKEIYFLLQLPSGIVVAGFAGTAVVVAGFVASDTFEVDNSLISTGFAEPKGDGLLEYASAFSIKSFDTGRVRGLITSFFRPFDSGSDLLNVCGVDVGAADTVLRGTTEGVEVLRQLLVVSAWDGSRAFLPLSLVCRLLAEFIDVLDQSKLLAVSRFFSFPAILMLTLRPSISLPFNATAFCSSSKFSNSMYTNPLNLEVYLSVIMLISIILNPVKKVSMDSFFVVYAKFPT